MKEHVVTDEKNYFFLTGRRNVWQKGQSAVTAWLKVEREKTVRVNIQEIDTAKHTDVEPEVLSLRKTKRKSKTTPKQKVLSLVSFKKKTQKMLFKVY